jgi:Tol biopolymer transport system component
MPLVSTSLAEFSPLARFENLEDALWHRWSPDSHLFYYWEKAGDQIVLKALDTTSGGITLKLMHDVDAVFYAPGTDRLISYAARPESASIFRLEPDGSAVSLTPTALEYAGEPVWATTQRNLFAIKGRRGMNYAISVVDVQTGSALELLPNHATDAGDPNWSPRANFVAATYAVSGATPEDRRVNLVWHNLQSGKTQTLADEFLSVYNLAWSDDEHYLAYVAWRAGGTSLEMLDTATGDDQTLLKHVDSVESITYNPDAQNFVVVWRDGQQPFYQEVAWNDTASPALALTPSTFRRSYFWSADGEVLLVKSFYRGKTSYTDGEGVTRIYGTHYETLLMTTKAGKARILAENLIGLGNPNWSPDGKLMAYTQWTKERELSLRITDAAGNELGSYPLDRGYAFEWVPCSGD